MGQVRRRSTMKKYDYNKDRRRAWKKSKQMPTVKCDQVKNAWDEKKTTKQNMFEMGLSYNPNTTLPIPKTKDNMISMSGEEVEMAEHAPKKASKLHVIQELEVEACKPLRKTLRLSQPEVSYCIHMMEKHGEDYKAMARDEKNYYQDTPKQIRKKILTFKGIPAQYNAYLKTKSGTMETS